MSQGAKSCEHCGIPTNPNRRYVPPTECHEREVHGELYWLCADCERSGAPLLKADPDFGQAPSNSTDTSQQSARQSDKDVTPQAFLVLGVITAAGPAGLVREEIYKIAKITNQAACARLNLLETKGLIVTEGERFVPDTRRSQRVYKLAAYAKARAAA